MNRWWLSVLLAAVLVAITVAAYWPVFSAEFVGYDDADYVFSNRHVSTGLNADNLGWAFTRYHSSNWHPLTWISHMLDAQLFGVDPKGAAGHHIVNVALHAANAVLLFLCLAYMTAAPWPSFLVAALFAVHPVNVESVAWVAQRKTTLSTLFAILSIWTYARYSKDNAARWYVASLICYVGSLLSKQTFVTMAFALLLLDYWPLRRKPLEPPPGRSPSLLSMARGWIQLLPEKLPYLLLAILASSVTLFVQQKAMRPIDVYPLSTRVENVVISYVRYIATMFWPNNLSVFYPLNEDKINVWDFRAALLLLVLLTAVFYFVGRRWRYFLFGWLWFLGTLVPVIGLVHVGSQSMADRYAYTSFWGLMIPIVWMIWDLVRSFQNRWASRTLAVVASLAMVSVLTACVVRSHKRAEDWHDTVSLFSAAVDADPTNGLAHRILATTFYAREDFQKSLHYCEEAFKYSPNAGPVLSTYGMVLLELGRPSEALDKLRVAAEIEPDEPLSYGSLGWAYYQLKRYEEADAAFAVGARKLNEETPAEAHQNLHINWARCLVRLNRLHDAARKYDVALHWATNPELILVEAADVDLKVGNVEPAVQKLQKALAINPRNAASAYLLAGAFLKQRNRDAAAEMYRTAFRLNPKNHLAAIALAKIIAQKGNVAEAEAVLTSALDAVQTPTEAEKNPAASMIRIQLGDLALARHQPDAALELYRRALVNWPENFSANNNIAWILATSPDEKRRNPKEAVALATRACELTGRRDPSTLGTLAAAYAADRQFPQAVKTAQEALALAKSNNDPAASQLEKQLRLHEQGKPYIDQ